MQGSVLISLCTEEYNENQRPRTEKIQRFQIYCKIVKKFARLKLWDMFHESNNS